ncbi:hypothetical protein P171DRAFT_514120, partial [Karstenula rhodostoma CBS 690.94]
SFLTGTAIARCGPDCEPDCECASDSRTARSIGNGQPRGVRRRAPRACVCPHSCKVLRTKPTQQQHTKATASSETRPVAAGASRRWVVGIPKEPRLGGGLGAKTSPRRVVYRSVSGARTNRNRKLGHHDQHGTRRKPSRGLLSLTLIPRCANPMAVSCLSMRFVLEAGHSCEQWVSGSCAHDFDLREQRVHAVRPSQGRTWSSILGPIVIHFSECWWSLRLQHARRPRSGPKGRVIDRACFASKLLLLAALLMCWHRRLEEDRLNAAESVN